MRVHDRARTGREDSGAVSARSVPWRAYVDAGLDVRFAAVRVVSHFAYSSRRVCCPICMSFVRTSLELEIWRGGGLGGGSGAPAPFCRPRASLDPRSVRLGG